MLRRRGRGCFAQVKVGASLTRRNDSKSWRRVSALQGFATSLGSHLHNAAGTELARGRYSGSHRLAKEALEQLSLVTDGAGIIASTRSAGASAAAELGQLAEGLREAAAAATEPGATADAIAEAAYLHAVCGRTQRARAFLATFDRGDAPWSRDLPSRAQACYARIALSISNGSLTDARCAWRELSTIKAADIDARSRLAVVTAMLALLEGSEEAPRLAAEAMVACSEQHAWRWMCRARLLDAAARRSWGPCSLD